MNIIITGGSQGIGYETALRLAGMPGHKILVIARNAGNLKRLMDQSMGTPSKIYTCQADLNTNLSLIVNEVREKLDNVDILINNAGYLVTKKFEEITEDDFDNVFRTNIRSVFFLVRDMLPYFNEGSHVVNISSMGGFQGSIKFPGLSAYSASKGALAVLSECLALELKDRNISVNCLAIGAAQTEMLGQAFPDYTAPVTALQMADFICNFAINGHRYMNGKILPVSLSTP